MGHRYDFHVFFGDCDAAGIVFYPRFFVWFDNSFSDWTREKGVSQSAMPQKFGVHATPIVDGFEARVFVSRDETGAFSSVSIPPGFREAMS